MFTPPVSRDRNAPRPARFLWDTPWLWLTLVTAMACVPLFIGLDRTDLENDEAIYSFAVETMLKDGDWLTPKSIPDESRPFLEKPPLKLWITALPMRLGLLPPGEFGLRFMDALMGALAFLYVFGIGKKLAGPLCGFAAVLLLFSHEALLFHHGLRSNNMESTTVLAYAAGVYHFLAWRSINPDVKRHVYGMALWFVFGFMTKFVAALFLPVILGIAALLRREDRGRLYRDWRTFALAAGVAIALILPWFVYQYVERGSELFDNMFAGHVVKRFTSFLDPAHLQPWHFYLTQLWSALGDAGTRTLTVVSAVLFIARTIRHRWTEGIVIILWFALPVTAISLGTSKLYHYLYPFLAPVALAGGWLLAVVARRLYAWGSYSPVLRAATVAIVLALVLPLSAYKKNVELVNLRDQPFRDVRDCLTPVVAGVVARGEGAPGVFADAGNVSHVPSYYMRTLGPWRLAAAADETLMTYLLRPEPRPLLLSRDRFEKLRVQLEPNPSFFSKGLGLAALPWDLVMVLPGPYAVCSRGPISPVSSSSPK